MSEKDKKSTVTESTQTEQPDQAAVNLAGWKRALADYENLKKETLRSQQQDRQRLTAELVGSFLPLVENLKVALEHLPDEFRQTAWARGFEHIYNDALTTLKQLGVTAYQTEPGSPFDPERHLAIGTVSEPAHDDQAIVKVGGGGYELNGQVIRPSPVIVNIKEEQK